MSFVNPNFRKLEKKLNNSANETNDNVVSLDKIIDINNIEPKKEKIEIEVISYPNNVIITDIPRSLSLSTQALGTLSIKGDNVSYNKTI